MKSKDGDADAAWLSESSGGFLFRIEDARTLPKTAQEIAFEIANYLAVRITLPELGFPEKLPSCASLSSKQ